MSRFRDAVKNREFLITAEVAPPKGGNPAEMLKMAQLLRGKVHGVNITDGSRAVLRMGSLPASVILLQNGIEPICQMTCRDRNSIALQADLMGAYALGIRNILALTGDPIKAGDHPDARAVFELESIRLLNLIRKLNNGFDLNDNVLTDQPTDLFAGGAVDPQLKSWSSLQRRFEKKIEAGCQFFQSQLITDFEKLDKFMSQIARQYDKPVLAGIFLLKSAKNARFINRYVPGVQIPDYIIERLGNAKHPLEEGVKIAAEQVKQARKLCDGVHLMAVKREDLIPEILDLAEVKPINE
jgi:methylenetetrahydrofolate reductase (NADPH)